MHGSERAKGGWETRRRVLSSGADRFASAAGWLHQGEREREHWAPGAGAVKPPRVLRGGFARCIVCTFFP